MEDLELFNVLIFRIFVFLIFIISFIIFYNLYNFKEMNLKIYYKMLIKKIYFYVF